MITPEFVKQLVEDKTNTNDLSIKSRKREFTDYRFLCFYLCRKFCSKRVYGLSKIGKAFNKDHATVLHGCNKIEEMLSSHTYPEIKKLYLECSSDIRKIMEFKEAENILKTAEEIELEYKLKHLELIEKSHSVINNLRRKIKNLKHREVFTEIAGLDDEKLDLMEKRMSAFLVMNK